MPGLYKDEGVVLRTIKLGESDRIVTLFTRSNGKIRAVAKGVRKTKSRFGGRLEPFTRVQLLIYQGRNLDTITSADIVTSFDEIRTDYQRLKSAAVMVELVDKITPDRESALSVYALLLAGLRALAKGGSDSIVPAFIVKLLSVSGYHPHLRSCAGCGNGHELIAFSPALGGAICEGCHFDDPSAFALGSDRVELLSSLLASDFGLNGDRAASIELTGALRGYAEYHLERPLRSLRFLLTAK
jgi:DNA repair protein RecO (recombination protein O)